MEIVYNGTKDTRMFNATIFETIDALMKEDEKVVWLDADLMSCSGTAKGQGERYINCGIAEANMIGIAGGLSASGKSDHHFRNGPRRDGGLQRRHPYAF